MTCLDQGGSALIFGRDPIFRSSVRKKKVRKRANKKETLGQDGDFGLCQEECTDGAYVRRTGRQYLTER